MAAPETKTYPKITRGIWWKLRDRLKKSVPTTITPTLINSLAPMTDASAKSNVIAPLRELGLIDEQGKPTPLAERWRHDDDYQAVCHEIRSRVYPAELIEAFPDPNPDNADAIRSWFMKVGKVGDNAARKYADTYLLLSDGDHTKAAGDAAATSTRATRTSTGTSATRKTRSTATTARHQPGPSVSIQPEAPDRTASHRRIPSIHIDVQVHIAPDTPPEQIERIFESMAKHLGGFVS